jgi:hypothetical protein
MAMAEHSISRQIYRTPDNEVREVSGMTRATSLPSGDRGARRRRVVAGQAASLARFAAEVEEISPMPERREDD